MSGTCLRTKPKFIRLHHMLGISPQTARGLLEFLWDSVQDTGDPVVGDADAIEAAAGWTGEPGKLCQALLHCGGKGKFGFIEELPNQEGIFQLHDLLQHTPADQVRKWIRMQERMERGTTIAEIRRAAANARWAKERAKNSVPMSSETSAALQTADCNANSDAKSCKTMQTGDVCMPLQRCASASDSCTTAVDVPSPSEAAVHADEFQTESAPELKVLTYSMVHDHFKAMAFYGDVNEFIKRYQAAIADPNSPAARRGWQSEAYLYACETQAKWARDFPNHDEMLRMGGKKLKSI